MSKIDPRLAKMSPADRAKQFAPFAALKGYEEALRAMEKKMEEENEAVIKDKLFDDSISESSEIP